MRASGPSGTRAENGRAVKPLSSVSFPLRPNPFSSTPYDPPVSLLPTPCQVSVSLGNAANQFVFEPSTIQLSAGRLTKLKFTNPSNVTHYFTALEFADKVYTVLVLAGDPQVGSWNSVGRVWSRSEGCLTLSMRCTPC